MVTHLVLGEESLTLQGLQVNLKQTAQVLNNRSDSVLSPRGPTLIFLPNTFRTTDGHKIAILVSIEQSSQVKLPAWYVVRFFLT